MNTKNKLRNNPWDPLLRALRTENVTPPRKLPGWKAFMHEHHNEILKAYDQEYPDKSSLQRSRDLKSRCEIARRMFGELSAEEQKVHEDMAAQQFKEESADFKRKRDLVTGGGTPRYCDQVQYVFPAVYISLDTDHFCRAREHAASTLMPLLDLVSKYTGCTTTLLLGAPPNEGTKNFHLQAVHSGRSATTGQTWSEFDKDGFQIALKHFSHFVAKTDRK